MHSHLCCEMSCACKQIGKQGLAYSFPHLHAGCFLLSQHSALCTPKCLENTHMSGLKFQSPRLGSTATKDCSAELVLGSELESWDPPMTLAALQHPAVAVQLLGTRAAFCLYSTQHNKLPVRFVGCCVIL